MTSRSALAATVLVLPVLAASQAPAAAPAAKATPATAADTRVAEARGLSRAGRPAEARKLLEDVVAAQPANRDAHKALLEAAILMKDWEACNAQTAALEPFAEGEEVSMFYAAVALHETGNIVSARPLVQRARPFLKPSPFVNWYTKEILGE